MYTCKMGCGVWVLSYIFFRFGCCFSDDVAVVAVLCIEPFCHLGSCETLSTS